MARAQVHNGRMTVNITSVALPVLCLLLVGHAAMSSEDKIIYQLTFETCGTKLAGTESDVSVSLITKSGNKTVQTFSGKGDKLSANKTDIVNLTSNAANDRGPICEVKLKLTNPISDSWQMRRLTVRHTATNDVGTFGGNDCEKARNMTGEKPYYVYYRDEPTDPWKVWGKCDCETRTRRRLPDPCRDPGGSDDERPCSPDEGSCSRDIVFVVIGSVLGFLALALIVMGVVCCIRHNQPAAPTVNIELPTRQLNGCDGLLENTVTVERFRERDEFQDQNLLVPLDYFKIGNISRPPLPAPYQAQEYETEYIYA